MYAVAIIKPDDRSGHIFPNIFPDLDMACDCIMYEIMKEYGEVLDQIAFDSVVGGQHYIHYEQTIYVVGKLFNFNPKGM